jgi:hypothetical protein
MAERQLAEQGCCKAQPARPYRKAKAARDVMMGELKVLVCERPARPHGCRSRRLSSIARVPTK